MNEKLTDAELADLRECEWWGVLWNYALPWAKYTIKQMIERGTLDPFYAREDLLQEGNLAVGNAVQTWDPAKGTLGTWVCANVRGHLLNYLGLQSNQGFGTKHVRSKTYQLQDKHTRHASVPDSTDALDELQTENAVAAAVETLPGLTGQIASARYRDGLSKVECAARFGLDLATVWRHDKIAKRKMHGFLAKRLHPS